MEYDKYDNLYNKIISKLNSDYIKKEYDVISLHDLKNICESELKKYNDLLLEKQPVYIYGINKRSKNHLLSKKDYPNLREIKSLIDDNNSYIKCEFKSNEKLYFIKFFYDEEGIIISETNFSNGEEKKFLEKNYLEIDAYLTALELFKIEFPNTNYEFSLYDKNVYDQSIKDGSFCIDICLNDPKKTHFGLNSLNDIITATTKTRKYGELYDYIDMYQDELMKKTAVNLNDLNSFIKTLVDKNLNYDKQYKKVLK